jgi:large subunit ribosomal protein L24e|tara:strand:- start:1338 stop:1532 length:195 start_codon:yes stop_codon:yes gene_type:complete
MFSEKKCTFCGADIPPSRGITYIRNDGVTQHFCSSKCRKNTLKLKRDPRKYKWTAAYKKPKSKK